MRSTPNNSSPCLVTATESSRTVSLSSAVIQYDDISPSQTLHLAVKILVPIRVIKQELHVSGEALVTNSMSSLAIYTIILASDRIEQ